MQALSALKGESELKAAWALPDLKVEPALKGIPAHVVLKAELGQHLLD